MTRALFRLLAAAALALPLAAAGANPATSISSVERRLFVPQNYGAHVIGDLTGNGLKDVAFLTQLGEGSEPGVLSLFTQDSRRRFSDLRRYQAPPGSRDLRIADIDADGANDLVIVHEAGLSRMRVVDGQLQRGLEPLEVEWPEEQLGDYNLLAAHWVDLDGSDAPTLVLPAIGSIGFFRWDGERYAYHCHVRARANAFNFGLNLGTMARRLTSYQRDDASLGADIEGGRFVLALPPMYFIDMDGDGDRDLVLCSPSRGQVSVHLNAGDGDFSVRPDHDIDCSSVTPEEALVGWVSERVSLRDFNGDGLPDVFVVKRGDRDSREIITRTLFLARAPFDYPDEPDQTFRVESIASQTVLRDFNGDGLVDMAFPVARLNISSLLTTGLTGSFRYAVRFFIQKPDAEPFASRPDYALGYNCEMSSLRETNGPYYVFDFDLTGNGANDLAIINDLRNLEIYQGDRRGRFGSRPWASLTVDRGVVSMFEDMDNDGVPDFLNLKQEQTARNFTLVIDFLDPR